MTSFRFVLPFLVFTTLNTFGQEISHYLNSNVRYEICTNCGGQPERTHTSLYTGWTNWEQQNFNIYTRKFVTNKVVKEHTSCKECEGGWKKK